MIRRTLITIISILIVAAFGSFLYVQAQNSSHPIDDLVWSPDGDYLIVQSEWYSWIYNTRNLDDMPVRAAGFEKVVFSPDGRHLAALTITGTGAALVSVNFDADYPFLVNHLPLRNRTIKDELEGCLIQPPPEEIAFSPTGSVIARIGTSSGGDGSVFIYSVPSGNVNSILHYEDCTVTDIAFSVDGSHIASSHFNGTIQILNVTDGSLIATLDGNFEQARAIAYSPDGESIAVLGQLNNTLETVIKIWDLEIGEQLHQLDGLVTSTEPDLQAFLEQIVYSPDGSLIAAFDEFYTIYLWDTATFDLVKRIENPAQISRVVFSPDGKQLAYAGDEGILHILDLTVPDTTQEIMVPTLVPSPTIEYPTRVPITRTPWYTRTPTVTPAFTATPVLTPFAISCADSPPTRLNVGMMAIVSMSLEGETRVNLRVRTEPGGEQVSSLQEGTSFKIIGEPVCFDGLTWWEIETTDGDIRGWSAEGFAPDDYFITPLLP